MCRLASFVFFNAFIPPLSLHISVYLAFSTFFWLIPPPRSHSILHVHWFPSCVSVPVYQRFHHSHNNKSLFPRVQVSIGDNKGREAVLRERRHFLPLSFASLFCAPQNRPWINRAQVDRQESKSNKNSQINSLFSFILVNVQENAKKCVYVCVQGKNNSLGALKWNRI